MFHWDQFYNIEKQKYIELDDSTTYVVFFFDIMKTELHSLHATTFRNFSDFYYKMISVRWFKVDKYCQLISVYFYNFNKYFIIYFYFDTVVTLNPLVELMCDVISTAHNCKRTSVFLQLIIFKWLYNEINRVC